MDLKAVNEKKTGTSNYLGEGMLLPAKSWYVFLSLFAALTLNFLPLQNIALALRPDFVAITLLYWGINQPQRIGISLAFCMGLMMDVGSTSILGQHALAYCVVVYITLILHRRLRVFSLVQQAPQVGLILLIMQIIILLIKLLSGTYFSGWIFFLATFTGTLLWAPISFLIGIPLRTKSEPDAL